MKTFICDECGQEFPLGDDDEAMAELGENFPGIDREECGIVCTKCYEQIREALQ